MRFTVDAIAGLAFGADVNTLESDEDVIQQPPQPDLSRPGPALAGVVSVLALLASCRPTANSNAASREVKAAIARFIAEARARLRRRPGAAQPPAQPARSDDRRRRRPGSGVDDRDVAGNVFTMLLAGEDTTANTLAWMIDLLHRHPEALRARARRGATRRRRDRRRSRSSRWRELDTSTPASHETMRLKPVAPLLPSQANRDTWSATSRCRRARFVICLHAAATALERALLRRRAGVRAGALAGATADAPRPRPPSACRCRSAPGRACARGATSRCSR